MSNYKGLEKIVSDLEYKFMIALMKSREDGDPKHRKKVITDAVKAIRKEVK